MSSFKPEGMLIGTPENTAALRSPAALQEAYAAGKILEARAIICDYDHNLIVDLGCAKGIIPRVEGALGIESGKTRDIAIISRVNKPTCFQIIDLGRDRAGVLHPVLSRARVQQQCYNEYISQLAPGDIIDAKVTHIETFGAFVDIGCGIPSLLPIDAISVSRIAHPSDRFRPGMDIKAVVVGMDAEGRVTLTHKELLGNWEENAAQFTPGSTVAGIVRSVEDYGVFVELSPNLAGLAEPCADLHPGQHTSVYIKNLIPEKMKVKLIIVDAFDARYDPEPVHYYITEGHLDRWRYSPECSDRVIETVFGG